MVLDIVFKRAPFVSVALIVAAFLWIYGYTVGSNQIVNEGWAVFIAGVILQIAYLLFRFVL